MAHNLKLTNCLNLKISGIFHLIFSDCGGLWETEIAENKTAEKGITVLISTELYTLNGGMVC